MGALGKWLGSTACKSATVLWLFVWYVVAAAIVVVTLSSVQLKQELASDPEGRAAQVLASIRAQSADLARAAAALHADQVKLGYQEAALREHDDRYAQTLTEARATIFHEAALAGLPTQAAFVPESWTPACGDREHDVKLAGEAPSCPSIFARLVVIAEATRSRAEIEAEISTLRTHIDYNEQKLAPGLTIDEKLMEGIQGQDRGKMLDAFGQLTFIEHNGLLAPLSMPSGLLTLFLTIAMGVLGSTITMTWTFLQPRDDTSTLQWFLLRPFIGALSAVVLFVLFKAGQITIAADDATATLNPFFLSLVGIVGGLLSDSAYRRMASVGEQLLSSPKEPERYGIDLEAAAQSAAVTTADLANLLDTTDNRMADILQGKAPASPTEQRLVACRLAKPRRQLFTDLAPATA